MPRSASSRADEGPISGTRDALTGGFLSEIDGLRALAISLVMLHHFWPTTGPLARFDRIGELGWVGVDLFFVISGFLITGILLDTKDRPHYFKNFYARRALRIFPLYYVFLGAVCLLPLTQPGPYSSTPFVQSSGSPLWYAFYLGNVPESLLGKTNPPYLLATLWSLAIEEQFYLTFPSIVARVTRRTLVRLLFVLLVGAPLFRLVTTVLNPANERLQYLFTLSRVDVLAMGGLLAVLVREPRLHTFVRSAGFARGVGRALCVASVVLGFTFALGGLDRTRGFGRVLGYSVVDATFALLVLWTVLHRGRLATSVLRWGPVRYGGKLCYGLYLLHHPAADLAERGLRHAGLALDEGSLALLALKVTAAVAVASLSWFAFEQPILRLKRFFASGASPVEFNPPIPPMESEGAATVPRVAQLSGSYAASTRS